MVPRVTLPPRHRRRLDEHLVRGVPVQAIDVDQRYLEDRERVIVRRVLAVGELVVGGERIAVERRQRRRQPADLRVVEIGERVEGAEAARERRQPAQVARRRGREPRRLRKVLPRVARIAADAKISVTNVCAGHQRSGDV